MTQYAFFDSTAGSPSPVLGWFDTGARNYTNLPPTQNLLALTPAQWAGRMSNPSGWAVASGALVPFTPPPPVLTLAQRAQVAMASGLNITSESDPSLNATYAVDSTSTAHIQAEMIAILSIGAFADGTSTIVWPDMAPVNHTFNITQFQAFALQVGVYVAALFKVINGTLDALPQNTASIP